MNRRLAIPLLSFATAGVISFAAFARPVRRWSPEELYERSDLVLIGIVTEVKDTGTTSTIRLASNPPLPVRTLRATVRVMEVVKGKTKDKVLIEYTPLDWSKVLDPVVNGPGRISLQEGRVYLMYLTKEREAEFYVGVLNGEYDDYQAVKELKRRFSEQPASPDAVSHHR
ncbi:hypothetical protein HQ563_13445 [bacterium]|nr:hypothetical protein [bacterium]